MSSDTNQILEELGEKGEEILREREERRRELFKQAQKSRRNRGNKKNKGQRGETPEKEEKTSERGKSAEIEASDSISFGEAMAGQMGYTGNKPDPELEIDLNKSFSREESDPFSELSTLMEQEVSTLSKPVRPNLPAKKKARKLSGRSAGSLGEAVTREHAEKLISEGKSGMRHRATIIVRTRVLDTEGRPVRSEAAAKVPAKEIALDNDPALPRLALVREDTGEIYIIDRDLSIGRTEDNDICIPRPDGHYVSEHHAAIHVKGRDIYLEDLQSRNGTYVNEVKIRSRRLKAGLMLDFGGIFFTVIES